MKNKNNTYFWTMWKIKQVCHDFLKDKRRGNYSLHMISNENPTDFVRFLIINVRWVCGVTSRITHICVLVVTVGNKEHFGNFIHSA